MKPETPAAGRLVGIHIALHSSVNTEIRRDYRRARTFLILFLILFGFGRVTVWMRRPVYPPTTHSLERGEWPPQVDIRVLNAVDSPLGNVHLFKGGTSIGAALDSLTVKVDPHRAGTVLPRAGILTMTSEGWTVRPMTQAERWIWRIPMDLNSSSSDDLRRIPGIGPVLAERIARHVSERVWIPDVVSLLLIKGVGPAKLKMLRKYLEVEGGSSKKVISDREVP